LIEGDTLATGKYRWHGRFLGKRDDDITKSIIVDDTSQSQSQEFSQIDLILDPSTISIIFMTLSSSIIASTTSIIILSKT
jgi:hypothetical protein